MNKLRIAIIGCKNMGAKHLKCLQNNFSDKVEVIGILNSTKKSSRSKAQELGVPYFESLAEIDNQKVDAVIISTPAESHYDIAKDIIEKEIPCMIEKPLACSFEDCQDLEIIAKEKSVDVLVGHIENYNPAVISLKKELADNKVLSISGIRTSHNPGLKAAHCISELMIHDLAIVNSLLGSDFQTAIVTKNDKYRWDEHAIVEMRFHNASIAKLEAIRADVPRKRQMRIIDDKHNIYQIEFAERKLIKNGEIISQGGDSLFFELANFIAMIKGEEKPFVSLAEGKENVHLCNVLEEISSL